jgi:hypothetical protein
MGQGGEFIAGPAASAAPCAQPRQTPLSLQATAHRIHSEANMTRRIALPALLTLAVCTLATGQVRAQAAQPPAAASRAKVPDLSGVATEGFVLDELRRIVRGFQIAPVPLDLQGKDLALVGLGSYIVNAQGGCNDCHTNPPFAPGGDPHMGQPKQINAARYLAGGTEFGPVTSRNLTPDAQGRPAGLTFDEFRRVLRTGVDLKHLPPHVPSEQNDLLQVMPWPIYREMIDRDIRAIYEFLRAIPRREGFPQ